ncbi:hypothetical protein BH10ACI2_BH10ACI2_17710 [soil metagenome]
MKKVTFLAVSFFCFAGLMFGQPRPVDKTANIPANSPDTFAVRYEGGTFGSSAKEKGSLRFDDANERVIFSREGGKEMFSIPYDSLIILYPDSKDSVPQSGKVLSKVPVPGFGLFDLMNKSTKYANLQFDDPQIEAKGTASFRFDKKEDLILFIDKLGINAKMVKRGDAYYRGRKAAVFFR